ncbi:ribosomal-processing cysteine protease Prp [Tindallia californiensis]|uniref:Ribosomal processing cysteine protease Prp n=1 Tax=Tindallia californiensis TaxID=159292 RepID=A0A1H3NED4_9FIRM|nr:ribosomal-processing cysteine protease Prp [Tindallia californiensis]SDY86549.1 hypothetical protein SAMN05192546_10556 [Tindallia californiensis]
MIRIHIFRNQQKDIVKYTVDGHANADKHGKDIVCAAISVLAQTMILGVHRILSAEPEWKSESGELICILPDNISIENRKQINALLETMVLGFDNIRQQYPDLIKIYTKEVR